ncbi:MAG: class I SAM-dependent methyltransferase [Deltaproteobacteria bacterium]|nr:class I SAM-dependent methyltransferase [Deltaproteobacteria bacterium]
MRFETRYVACNLCGSEDASVLWKKNGFRYVKCRVCGLVFVNPQLEEFEIKRIYSILYPNKSENKARPLDVINYSPVLNWAEAYRCEGRFLDVGCFRGYLLSAARHLGWDAFGTEISAAACAYGRSELGLNIFHGQLTEAGYPDNYFDVAVLFDVIEHLSDPILYLYEIFRLLRPGGGLYLFTPNFNSLTCRFFGKDWSVFFPWHQYYFSPRTLDEMIRRAGLKAKKIRCFGIGPVSRRNAYEEIHTLKIPASNVSKAMTKIKTDFSLLRKAYFLMQSSHHVPYGSKITALAEKPF